MNRTATLAALAILTATAPLRAETAQSTADAYALAIAGLPGGNGPAGGTSRVVSVPAVVAPSFYGANPCSNSTSAGGAFMGGGVTIGAQWTERECRLQEWFRFLSMARRDRLAIALVCDQNPDIRRVAREIGEPCPQDAQAPQPPAQVQPVAAVTPTNRSARRPDWCDTASASERARHRATCG